MAVTTTRTNKPINPRGNDQSPKGYNRAALYSGKALDFDGVNDEITPSGSYFVDPQSGTWTFCAYIYAENSGVVFSRDNQWVELRLLAGKLVARVYDGAWQNLTLSNVDLLNEWHFVCWKYDVDNSTFTGYVNGVEQLTETTTPNVIANFDRIASTGGSNFFDGKIGGVKIYDVGLTAAQVSDLYNNPEKIVPTGVSNDALKLWLPMMEGAGTTAYDGSGNGNHGTISGATYVNGVGSPVAQTAVMDWNKGTNLISDSEDFSQWSNVSQFVIYSTDDTTAPDGQTTADKITEDTSSNHHRFYKQIVFGTELGINQSYTISGFVKYIDRQYVSIGLSDNSAYNGLVNFDLINGTIGGEYSYNGSTISNKTITSVGNDWWKFSVTITSPTWVGGSIYAIAYLQQSSSVSLGAYLGESKSVHVWGWNMAKENYTTSYIPTFGTAQSSEVLLPQGLTSGRDITGVNLFENVRKQGALNLDGNSWAEVHDNASVDFSSGMSLEAWIKLEDTNQAILGKWNFAGNKKEYLLYYNASTNLLQAFFGNGSSVQFTSTSYTGDGSWVHFVGTTDGSTITPYLNGVAGTTVAQTTPLGASDIPVRIGVDDVGLGYSPNQIAQPRIYNRALTAEEVERNYNAGKNIYK